MRKFPQPQKSKAKKTNAWARRLCPRVGTGTLSAIPVLATATWSGFANVQEPKMMRDGISGVSAGQQPGEEPSCAVSPSDVIQRTLFLDRHVSLPPLALSRTHKVLKAAADTTVSPEEEFFL